MSSSYTASECTALVLLSPYVLFFSVLFSPVTLKDARFFWTAYTVTAKMPVMSMVSGI